jgi:hypothetical protein
MFASRFCGEELGMKIFFDRTKKFAMEELLEFASAHVTKLPRVTDDVAKVDSGRELKYRHVAPLLDARGNPTRKTQFQSSLVVSEQADHAPLMKDEMKRRKKKKTDKETTAGSSHFDVPNTEMTPELETTFKMLEMRPFIFKDAHYKVFCFFFFFFFFSHIFFIAEGQFQFSFLICLFDQ